MSAPSSPAIANRSADRSLATMCAAPDVLSNATNISPIGPHPSTAYDLPGRRSSFCSAPIAQLTGSVSTAVSTGVPAGSLIACDCGMTGTGT